MARSIDWEGTNFTLGPPPGVGEDQCGTLKAFANDACIVSIWEPDAEEMAEIIRTGQIAISVWTPRNRFPPIFVGSESVTHALVADYGPVWKLRKPKLLPDNSAVPYNVTIGHDNVTLGEQNTPEGKP